MNFKEADLHDIDVVMKAAKQAAPLFNKISATQKASFLETIAHNIEQVGDRLILKAAEETNLPTSRLMGERARTAMQLRSFAQLLREGSWVEASIDTAIAERQPVPKPDLRKMLVPLGPVVVFGASNFPFAFSTAGGDTASALAAGCPVVVKAHPAHAQTSQMVYEAIEAAIKECDIPAAVFQHVHGAGFETGRLLVQHEDTAAVGFTGSFIGGKALYDYAQERKNPIPVFSEMGSVNPAVFLPDALLHNAKELARSFAVSITAGMGQFCTKPGLLFGVESDSLAEFIKLLGEEITEVRPAKMLHPGIVKLFNQNAKKALSQQGVRQESKFENDVAIAPLESPPALASVMGDAFLKNPLLHEEVFGPFALMIRCKDMQQLKQAWKSVRGQLTTSIIGTDKDLQENSDLAALATEIAGRVVFNGVPTGVEVCASMVHGGPYPASTDGRFTAVGVNAIRRWVRPVCFQNCPEFLLPDELKNGNPLNIWRMVNNEWTKKDLRDI